MIFFLFLKLFFQVSFHNLIPIYINICAYDLFSFAFVKEKSVEYELIDMYNYGGSGHFARDCPNGSSR